MLSKVWCLSLALTDEQDVPNVLGHTSVVYDAQFVKTRLPSPLTIHRFVSLSSSLSDEEYAYTARHCARKEGAAQNLKNRLHSPLTLNRFFCLSSALSGSLTRLV